MLKIGRVTFLCKGASGGALGLREADAGPSIAIIATAGLCLRVCRSRALGLGSQDSWEMESSPSSCHLLFIYSHVSRSVCLHQGLTPAPHGPVYHSRRKLSYLHPWHPHRGKLEICRGRVPGRDLLLFSCTAEVLACALVCMHVCTSVNICLWFSF